MKKKNKREKMAWISVPMLNTTIRKTETRCSSRPVEKKKKCVYNILIG